MTLRRWMSVIGAGTLLVSLLAVTAVGLGPWRARLLMKHGAALLSEERYASAARTLGLAVALEPDDARAHFRLGLAYAELGERDAALRHLQDAVRLAPKRPQYEVGLAGLLLDTGRFSEAIPHLRAALALEPHAADLGPPVMADNRNAGEDSRHWGPVSHAQIVGRRIWIYWSSDADGHTRWSRVGLRVR